MRNTFVVKSNLGFYVYTMGGAKVVSACGGIACISLGSNLGHLTLKEELLLWLQQRDEEHWRTKEKSVLYISINKK
jgi:hypothetical protein